MNRSRPTLAALGLIAILASASTSFTFPDIGPDDTWPQWRGPGRDSRVTLGQWPEDLSEVALQRSWRRPLAKGYSGPIVSGERVFVTESRDSGMEAVRALDRSTGSVIWETEWSGAIKVPFFAARNGNWIKATPAFDGRRLFVLGMEDRLVALDATDGSTLWSLDLAAHFGVGRPEFGGVSSPLLADGSVFIQGGRSFLRLDPATGETIWRTLIEEPKGMYGGAFASPVLATVHGEPVFLVQTREALTGIRPSDGSLLWRQPLTSFRGMLILDPTPHGDGIFTSTYRDRSYFFDVRPDGDAYRLEPRWESKAMAYMSAPVVVADHVYVHLQNKRVACLNLTTGEETWRTSESFGDYWSMVTLGDRILALDSDGELVYFRANPDRFDLLDRRQISDESTWGHLAVVGNEIFVRELEGIAAFRWE